MGRHAAAYSGSGDDSALPTPRFCGVDSVERRLDSGDLPLPLLLLPVSVGFDSVCGFQIYTSQTMWPQWGHMVCLDRLLNRARSNVEANVRIPTDSKPLHLARLQGRGLLFESSSPAAKS